ncbi:MAG: hypothetical protein KJP00_06735 [Bacteroidia bacterium]|nr:hypothetical protein [Bacteroidia bacterium]
MSKTIIGTLVGALILFIWQFISWGLGDLHYNQMSHTPQQEAILEALAEFNLEDGDYFVPRVPKGATEEENQALTEASLGKPWAIIKYRNEFTMSMGSNMLRGFVIDFLAVFMMIWIFGKMTRPDFKTIVMTCLAVGFIGYLTIAYLNSIWFQGNTIADLMDAIVSWGVVGAWLGWWLNRS